MYVCSQGKMSQSGIRRGTVLHPAKTPPRAGFNLQEMMKRELFYESNRHSCPVIVQKMSYIPQQNATITFVLSNRSRSTNNQHLSRR